jgi:hypothetical protein
MSETVPLEQLLNEKTTVEDEGRELDEEQKQLKARAKLLTEKIIQELKKKNNGKQHTVNQLQSTVNDLENQLNSLSAPTPSLGAHEDAEENEPANEANIAFKSEASTVEDNVSVTEVAEEIEANADSKDKKKRKFF